MKTHFLHKYRYEIFVFLVVCLLVVSIINSNIYCRNNYEYFSNLNPGNYNNNNNMLLDNSNKKSDISDLNTTQILNNFPINSAHDGSRQRLNMPDNGKCTPIEFCGSAYTATDIPNQSSCAAPGFNNKRVNYYSPV